MLILGIDPGTATTGYGFIKTENNIPKAVEFGLIETSKETSSGERLIDIHRQISALMEKFRPDVVAIEKLFFATNAKTAMSVGEAKGILVFSAAKHKLSIFEYAPGTIKKMVGGSGRADKKEIQRAIRQTLGNGIRSKPKQRTHFDNAADALAVALCHFYTINAKSLNTRREVTQLG